MKKCYTKTCKEVHLLGTRRSKPREENNREFQNRENRYTNQFPPLNDGSSQPPQTRPAPWAKTQESVKIVKQNGPSEPEKENHFLARMLEQMKADIRNMREDLTKTIDLKLENALKSQVPLESQNQHYVPQPQIPPQHTAPTQMPVQNSHNIRSVTPSSIKCSIRTCQ
jgi:hypothetical protein